MTDDGNLSDLEKMAVDNVIKRQQGLFDLMRHTDVRAQQFIVAYGGFTGAALLFAAREFATSGPKAKFAGLMLLTYAIATLFGAVFGFRACKYTKLALPARSADFWIWAMKPDNKARAISVFLENAEKQILDNEATQSRAARMLRYSMACGAAAVATAGVGAALLIVISLYG